MNLVAWCRSRIGLGALVVVLGAVGTVATARLVQEDSEDARRFQSGPLVASARPALPLVPLQRQCPSSAGAGYYFPRGAFVVEKEDFRPLHPRYRYAEDDKEREFYAHYLEAAKEPPLWCASPGVAESYRFLLVPSLRGEAACVRIERRGVEVRLLASLLTTTGGSILDTVDKKLEKADWDDLQVRLNAAGFWTDLGSSGPTGVDGTSWIVEGRRNGTYKLVDRSDPSPQDAAFEALGMRFLELARMTTAVQ